MHLALMMIATLATGLTRPSSDELNFVSVLGGPFGKGALNLVYPLPREGAFEVRDPRGKLLPRCSWPEPRGAQRHWGCARGLRAGGRVEVTLSLGSRPRPRRPAAATRSSPAVTRLKESWLVTGRGLRAVIPEATDVVLGTVRTRARSTPLLRELRLEARAIGESHLECLRRDRRGLELRKRGLLALGDHRQFDVEVLYLFDLTASSLQISMRFTSRNVTGRGIPIQAVARLSRRGGSSLERRWGDSPCRLEVMRDGRLLQPQRKTGRTRFRGEDEGERVAFVLGSARKLRFEFPAARHFTPFRIDFFEPERLRLDLVSDELDWWPGQRARRELVVEAPPPESGAVGRAKIAAARLRPDSGFVFPELAASLIERVADQMSLKTWRGEANAGDYRWARGRAANLEYDHIAGLLHLAGRGRPDSLSAARRALRHLLDRDLDRDIGLPRRHGARHRGPVDLGHLWLEGPLALAWICADRAASEELVAVIEAFRRRVDARREEDWSTLDLSWTLLNLAVIHEYFRAPEDAARIEVLLRVWLETWRAGWPGLDPLPRGDLRFVSTWIGPGVLGEALARLPDSRLLRRARRAFSALLTGLVDRVVDEKTERVHRGLVVDAQGQAVVSKKHLEGEEILFLALGLARNAEWENRPLNEARRLLRRAEGQFRCEDVRFPGKRLSQILWVASRRRR
jgi:hypothetical protein